MEKGLNQYILDQFELSEVDIKTYSPLTLAYIGDGIYDLIIRTLVVSKGNQKVNHMHRETSEMVKAAAQSEMIEILLPELTEKETEVYKRGRNAKSATMAKNATMADYRRATGFEALMGYLYLNNEMERILYLIKVALDRK